MAFRKLQIDARFSVAFSVILWYSGVWLDFSLTFRREGQPRRRGFFAFYVLSES
jgi:hypothetical protein